LVKRKPDGAFSEWLFGANREGARLETFGPLGKATFEPGLGKNLLLVAGGSGIAGMMSILARAEAANYFAHHKGWVFFGVRTMKDAFFLEELSQTKAEVTVALSEDDVPQHNAWPGLKFQKGLVHEVAKSAMAGKYHNVRAYVAGPPPAVDAAIRVLLLDAKLTTDNIRYDKFS
ncbi:MAG TPA: methanesulfonate monooxygenase, partial [Burkholderiales bacterium]|nr:methanesulfonate monooxygenase [Burkholderiales bacterium]